MQRTAIAVGLLVASLILLSVYGADAAVAASNKSAGHENQGFLPLSASARGAGLGGGAVIMAIIAFVISFGQRSYSVAILLFINGGLIIAGMIGLIFQGALAGPNQSGAISTIGSTIGLGAILIGLGAWKSVRDRKMVSRNAQTQR